MARYIDADRLKEEHNINITEDIAPTVDTVMIVEHYCNEHNTMIVSKENWEEAKKALMHFNDIKADLEKWGLYHGIN